MLDFLRIGNQIARFEPSFARRWLRKLVGHVGLGYAIRFWHVKRMLRRIKEPVCRIGDYGCSNGMFTFYLGKRFAQAQITGIDGDEEAIEQAQIIARSKKDAYRWTFQQAAFADAPPAPESTDLLVCLDALYYTDQGLEYLNWFCTALQPGGYVLLSLPYLQRHYRENFYFFDGEVERDALAALYLPERIRDTLMANRLTILQETEYPPPFATRMLRDQAAGKRYTYLLYPLLLCLVWLASFMPTSRGTHFIMLARKSA